MFTIITMTTNANIQQLNNINATESVFSSSVQSILLLVMFCVCVEKVARGIHGKCAIWKNASPDNDVSSTIREGDSTVRDEALRVPLSHSSEYFDRVQPCDDFAIVDLRQQHLDKFSTLVCVGADDDDVAIGCWIFDELSNCLRDLLKWSRFRDCLVDVRNITLLGFNVAELICATGR